MRQSLVELLGASLDDSGQLIRQAIRAIAKLTELDYHSMVDFLVQTPSALLCYAIGCVAHARANPEEMVRVSQAIEALLALGADGDSIYCCALLWGLSQEPVLLARMDLFDRFFGVAVDCLRAADPEVVEAATHALERLLRDRPQFVADGGAFVLDLARASELFAPSLPFASAVRIFVTVTWLLVALPNPAEGFGVLLAPIVAGIEEGDHDTIELLRDILDDVLRAAIPMLAELLLGGVHRLAKASRYEAALGALASLLTDASQIEGFVRLLASGPPVAPVAFTTIAKLRRTFGDVSEMSPTLFEMLIVPASEQEDPPVAEMLELVAALKGGWVDFEWLMETGIEAIGSLDWAVNTAAVYAMIRLWREMATADFRTLMATYGERTAGAVLAALADAMLKEVVDDYLKLLRKMWL
jgi:hypothetical protein